MDNEEIKNEEIQTSTQNDILDYSDNVEKMSMILFWILIIFTAISIFASFILLFSLMNLFNKMNLSIGIIVIIFVCFIFAIFMLIVGLIVLYFKIKLLNSLCRGFAVLIENTKNNN